MTTQKDEKALTELITSATKGILYSKITTAVKASD